MLRNLYNAIALKIRGHNVQSEERKGDQGDMKTIAKLMALCLLLGTFAVAQNTGGDKKGGDDKSAASTDNKDAKGKKAKKGKKDKDKDKDKDKPKDDKGGDKK